jgi:hypothetical protein
MSYTFLGKSHINHVVQDCMFYVLFDERAKGMCYLQIIVASQPSIHKLKNIRKLKT